MNFFEAQDKARRQTGWLVLLFLLAVTGLIIVTNLLILAILAYNQTGQFIFSPYDLGQYFAWDIFIGVAVIIFSVVFMGSLYKTMTLSGGGRSVAEMLGGRLINPGTRDMDERRLLNVVEEMAIASGMPVPPVYLMEEAGINAFAAGKTPNNAVIGITRGAITQLSRNELQGVIAHEFSHIFNGDMRMNIRLIGVLHGILLIGLIGYYILRGMRYVRSSRNRNGGNAVVALLALGGGFVVVGYVGYFFGQWIKSMVSRQREYLADASAVQYTRDREGIAGALKKIGGSSMGSLLNSPAAPEYSHAYFSKGIGGFLQSLFATHPPLERRIRRIEPNWDGEYISPKIIHQETESSGKPEDLSERKAAVLGAAVAAGILSADEVVEHIGRVTQNEINNARAILDTIPDALKQAAQDSFGARAIVYGMLLDSKSEVRQQQVELLGKHADPAVVTYTQKLAPVFSRLPEQGGLPLLELALSSLKSLSDSQYQQFRQVIQELISTDNKVDIKEWIMQRFVIQQLDYEFGLRKRPKEKFNHLGAVKTEAEIIISLASHIEHAEESDALQAFEAAKKSIGAGAFQFIPRTAISLESINLALDKLEQLKPLLKPRILKACAACIMYDDKATVRGEELLRTISICLDSPMPPLRKHV